MWKSARGCLGALRLRARAGAGAGAVYVLAGHLRATHSTRGEAALLRRGARAGSGALRRRRSAQGRAPGRSACWPGSRWTWCACACSSRAAGSWARLPACARWWPPRAPARSSAAASTRLPPSRCRRARRPPLGSPGRAAPSPGPAFSWSGQHRTLPHRHYTDRPDVSHFLQHLRRMQPGSVWCGTLHTRCGRRHAWPALS